MLQEKIINNSMSTPLTEKFGLIINDFNPTELNKEMALELKNLLYKNKILIFKNIHLTPEKYIQFAKCFGELVKFVDLEYRHPDFPEIFVVSNVKKNGKKFGMDRVGYYWHSDSSFMPQPLPIIMLYSQIVPQSGGETAFIDMNSAYERLIHQLPANTDELQGSHEGKWRYLITEADIGLSIEEILERDEQAVPSQVHPLVFAHPVTKKKALYLSQGITKRIVNLPEAESRQLISRVWEEIERESAYYKHQWQENELVIWDNRSVIHRAFPSHSGQSRLMFRIGVNDGDFFKASL
jgi:taurine dioxygenase